MGNIDKCDVFMVDGATFQGGYIPGNFSAGDDCTVKGKIVAEGDIFFGDFAIVDDVITKKNIYFGDNAHAVNLDAGGNLFFGDYADMCNIGGNGNATFGENAHIDSITVDGDVFVGDNAVICSVVMVEGNFKAGRNLCIGFDPDTTPEEIIDFDTEES